MNVVNDIQTANDPSGQFRYEFYQIPFTEFADKDGNPFADAQGAADYITQEGNVLGVADVGTSLNGVTVNFRLDQTNTSIIMDNGAAFGVNTIKAVADTDGTIHIHAIGAGVPADSNEPDDHRHFEGLAPDAVQINGVAVPGGISDVVNALNELFTVGPFEAVVISDPYSTMIADVNGIPALYNLVGSTAVDPVGSDIFANTSSGNYAGLKSQATIDQAGEYFTFDIRVEGQIGFGLVHSDASFAAGKYQGNATYADPSTFAVGNSAHYGYQFSHWFHPTPNGSWTNYGASTGYVGGPGWSNWDQKQDWLDGNPVKIRVGIDENSFIAISSLQDDGSWVLHARSSYPAPEGSEFHLGIKAAYPQPRVFSAPQVHLLEPAAPTLYFRYIESPDGYYSFPLFATQEEADYYEEQTSGSANGSHTHVYPDDPSQTTWYMPATSHQMNYGLTPVEDGVTTFLGNPINWTEITSLTNADLIPPAFTGSLTVNEGSAVNYQTQPADTSYTTTFSGLEGVLDSITDSGAGTLLGSAPEVGNDNVANPKSDVYIIGVHRTNTYGTSSGTLTLTVLNLTAPVTTINGITAAPGSPVLVADDTLDDGTAVSVDDTVESGNRFIINQAFVTDYVKPAIGDGQTGDKSVFVGFASDTADWSNGVTAADFEIAFEFFCSDTDRANGAWRLRVHNQGVQVYNVGIGGLTSTNSLYDYALINDGTELKLGAVVTSQGYDMSTLVFDTQAPWNWGTDVVSVADQSRQIYIGTAGTTFQLALTEFSEAAEPINVDPVTTDWNYAVDFSGSNEYMYQNTTDGARIPMKMAGLAKKVDAPSVAGNTSNDTDARPWATTVVFRADGNASNQHIWNMGSGNWSGSENIFLRLSAIGELFFQWGKEGSGYNECKISEPIASNQHYGVYIAHNGARFDAAGVNATKLAAAFDIYIFTHDSNGAWSLMTTDAATDGTGQRSLVANWIQSSRRTDQAIGGRLTVGGRFANRSFHGKIAGMTTTTLRTNQPMPDTAEAMEMTIDPRGWYATYRDGNPVRFPEKLCRC